MRIEEISKPVPMFSDNINNFHSKKCDCGKSGTSVYCINIPECWYNKPVVENDIWDEAIKEYKHIGYYTTYYQDLMAYIRNNYTLIKK